MHSAQALTPTRAAVPPLALIGQDGEADDDFDYPLQRVVPAAQAEAPTTRAVRSIFDMAAAAAASQALRAGGRFGASEQFKAQQAPQVTRVDGVVRVVGARYPANRWDEQRHEQERARRARQKPPRPTKRARTKSKKLRDMIGGEEFHDD